MGIYIHIHDQNNYFMKLRVLRAYAMQIGLRKSRLIFAFIKIFGKCFELLCGYFEI